MVWAGAVRPRVTGPDCPALDKHRLCGGIRVQDYGGGRKKAITGDFVCVATGPSLTADDCAKAAGSASQVIVVNDAYRLIPDADYLYACDPQWWKVHIDRVRETFSGKLYTQWHDDAGKEFAAEHGLTALEGSHDSGLGLDKIHFNENSGAQAINLAYLLGAKRIILLGYDMGWSGGKSHFFGDHPPELTTGNHFVYVESFTKLARDLKAKGVEVINCTRETMLYQFPRAELSAVL